jgi:Na+-driven multidrug efflux pump
MIQSCACIVTIIVNNTLVKYGGDLQIGAYGIANRVAFLFTMVVLGLSQGMQPIVGYNYGAKKFDRVKKILFMTIAWGTATTTLGFVICEFFPEYVVSLFVSEDGSGSATQLIEATVHGMRILLLMFPIVGFAILVGNFFQFIGKAKRAIILSMSRQMLFIVPLLLTLPRFWGTDGVWYAIPIADAAAVLLAAILLTYQLRHLGSDKQI